MTTITAVGDLLVSGRICDAALVDGAEVNEYDFDSLFQYVREELRSSDLTIGNLEVPISGNDHFRRRISQDTGLYRFNAPESLADALKRAGFDVLTTANNHCLDNGIEGMLRTLQVLDERGIAHTGTYASEKDSKRFLIKRVNDLRIGILAYSKGTNLIPIPEHMPWAVNLTDEAKMREDVQRMRPLVDFLIVCIHFGKEYTPHPTKKQQRQMKLLFDSGADLVLGAHPHVLQPLVRRGKKVGIYSLGNFVSTRLFKNPYTSSGLMLRLGVRKAAPGRAEIVSVDYLSTWTLRRKIGNREQFRILPIRPVMVSGGPVIPLKDRKHISVMLRHAEDLIGRGIRRER